MKLRLINSAKSDVSDDVYMYHSSVFLAIATGKTRIDFFFPYIYNPSIIRKRHFLGFRPLAVLFHFRLASPSSCLPSRINPRDTASYLSLQF